MTRIRHLALVIMAIISSLVAPFTVDARHPCVEHSFTVRASSTCEVFNNNDNNSPEFVGGLYHSHDQSTGLHVTAGSVVEVTASHSFNIADPRNPDENDYWCSALAKDSPPSPGRAPNANQCSWANGMKTGAPIDPIESLPGQPMRDWPLLPLASLALRIGNISTTTIFIDSKPVTIYLSASRYFQAFPNGPTAELAGVNAGSNWQKDFDDWSFLSHQFAVEAGGGGELFACNWAPNARAKYGSIRVKVKILSGEAICEDD